MPLLQETFRCDFLCTLVRNCLSVAVDAVFQCLCVGGGTSMCTWADVSKDACQVYVAVHSLSLTIQVWYAKWIYCTAAWHQISLLFAFKMTHLQNCPWVTSICGLLPIFVTKFVRHHRQKTLILRKEKRVFVPNLATNGCFFLYVPVAFSLF